MRRRAVHTLVMCIVRSTLCFCTAWMSELLPQDPSIRQSLRCAAFGYWPMVSESSCSVDDFIDSDESCLNVSLSPGRWHWSWWTQTLVTIHALIQTQFVLVANANFDVVLKPYTSLLGCGTRSPCCLAGLCHFHVFLHGDTLCVKHRHTTFKTKKYSAWNMDTQHSRPRHTMSKI